MLMNPSFTTYSFVIRYVFFGISLLACVAYALLFRTIPKNERIIEQKIILALSILLCFFNDPFYTITVLYPNKASSFFSALFMMTFIIVLFFSWIVFLDRIYF